MAVAAPDETVHSLSQTDYHDGRSDESVEVQMERTKVEEPPPDGGYGWVCVICISLINGE
jgi:hypothetical protein